MGNFHCLEFEATHRVVSTHTLIYLPNSLILSVIFTPSSQNFMIIIIVSIMLFITHQGAKIHEQNNQLVCS